MIYDIYDTGCSLNIVFFPRILESLPPLPRQHSTAIGCTKNYICIESFQGLFQRSRRGRGGKLSRILGKNTIFNEHSV